MHLHLNQTLGGGVGWGVGGEEEEAAAADFLIGTSQRSKHPLP